MILVYDTDGNKYPLRFEKYPDGTSYLLKDPDIPYDKLLIVYPTHIDDTTMMNLWLFSRMMWYKNPGKTKTNDMFLLLPFFPGSRQDKELFEDGVDMLFTGASICGMLKQLEYRQTYTIDVHSPYLFSKYASLVCVPTHELLGENEISHLMDLDLDFVIAPDKGAEHRAKAIADIVGAPCIYLQKERDPKTGEVGAYKPIRVGGAKVLVVDDICDGGRTFLEVAKALDGAGELNLFVTHGLFTKGTAELLKVYKNIFTTDTTPSSKPRVVIFPIVSTLIERIVNERRPKSSNPH